MKSESRGAPKFVTEVAVEALGGAIAAMAIGWLGQGPALVGLVGGAVLASRIEPKAIALLHRHDAGRSPPKPKAPPAGGDGKPKPAKGATTPGKSRRPSLRSSLLITGTAVLLVLSSFTVIDLARGESLIGDRETSFIPDPKPDPSIPRVTGQREGFAQARLERAGFRVVTTYEPSDRAPGIVVATTPQAGERAKKNSRVTMVVSQARGRLVPAVSGRPYEEGEARLETWGFTVEQKDLFDDLEAGVIIRTDPHGGDRAPRGSVVAVYVSLGPGTEVPALEGSTLDQATAALQELGLGIESTSELADDTPGSVIRSDPEAGELLAEGGIVTVVLSLGPGQDIPDVAGAFVGDAIQTLRAEGFAVLRVYESHPFVLRERVIRTEPPAGTTVANGSPVTIVASRGPESQVPGQLPQNPVSP